MYNLSPILQATIDSRDEIDTRSWSDDLKWKTKHDIAMNLLCDIERTLRAITSPYLTPGTDVVTIIADILADSKERLWCIACTQDHYEDQGNSPVVGQVHSCFRIEAEALQYYFEAGFDSDGYAGKWEVKKLDQ